MERKSNFTALFDATVLETTLSSQSIVYLLSFMMYSLKSKPLLPLARKESVWLNGQMTHFCRRLPMNNCRPMRANTLRQNTVRIITSDSFFTDCIRAPTMVFSPVGRWGDKHNEEYTICNTSHNAHTHRFYTFLMHTLLSHTLLCKFPLGPTIKMYLFIQSNMKYLTT